jgi:hypothetical protein
LTKLVLPSAFLDSGKRAKPIDAESITMSLDGTVYLPQGGKRLARQFPESPVLSHLHSNAALALRLAGRRQEPTMGRDISVTGSWLKKVRVDIDRNDVGQVQVGFVVAK